MGPSKDEVLEMLAAYAGLPKPSGPVTLSAAYLRAVERWEALPDNAAGAEKSWVSRCQEDFKAHFSKAAAGREKDRLLAAHAEALRSLIGEETP